MWILLPKGTVPQAGDEFLTGIGFEGQPCWKPVDSGMWISSDAALRRELTGWEAVKHALKAEVLGNDKEGCETIPWMWECECDKNFLHVYSEFPRCNKCGAWDSDQPNARKAEVILKIMEEK